MSTKSLPTLILTVFIAGSLFLFLSDPVLAQQRQGAQWDDDGGYDGDYSRIPRLQWTGPGAPGTHRAYLLQRGSAPFQATFISSTAPLAAGSRATKALVVVNTGLYAFPQIQGALATYTADLAAAGFQVEMYQAYGGTDIDMKNFILGHAANLAGCVFVGDQPAAWYEMEIWDPEQFPCDLYFMDLDGAWADGDGDGKWDGHTSGSGDEGPEIYVGRIDASMMNGNEVTRTLQYLNKNHAYRTKAFPLPNHALSYTEDDWASYNDMRTDIKHAYPSFDDIPAPATEASDYLYNRVPNTVYEFIQLCCHSSSVIHAFTRGGYVYNTQIKSVVPHAVFYNLFCCSTLRFTEYDYLGGAYIYNGSETSLAVIGSTKTGSMLTFSAFYQPLGQYETFGEAFRQWFNYLAPYDDDEKAWHFGMTIAGDPFLAMMEPALYFDLPEGLPEGHLPPGPDTRLVVEIKGGSEGYQSGTGKLHYRFAPGDPYDAVALTDLGNDRFEGILPGARPGDAPEFYFSAQGDGGTTLYEPFHAPNDVHAFEIGFVVMVLEDDFESDKGWTVGNTSITTGAWERANPAGTDAQPEDDHSPNGTFCYVTGKGGGGIGDDDVDGGPTRLKSPAIDLSDGDAVIRFYLWFYHSTNGTFEPLEMQITNTGGSPWTKVMDLAHNPVWQLYQIKVSDYVTPSSDVRLRFSASDNPNDSVVEALVDDFEVIRIDEDPELWADAYSLPVSTGGVIQFTLSAGPANGSRPYLLLGSATGTVPGVPLPGGAVLPLKWDFLTTLIMGSLGSPVFLNFTGSLDSSGEATATLDTFGPVNPAAAGATFYFACMLSPNPFFASNAMKVVLEP